MTIILLDLDIINSTSLLPNILSSILIVNNSSSYRPLPTTPIIHQHLDNYIHHTTSLVNISNTAITAPHHHHLDHQSCAHMIAYHASNDKINAMPPNWSSSKIYYAKTNSHGYMSIHTSYTNDNFSSTKFSSTTCPTVTLTCLANDITVPYINSTKSLIRNESLLVPPSTPATTIHPYFPQIVYYIDISSIPCPTFSGIEKMMSSAYRINFPFTTIIAGDGSNLRGSPNTYTYQGPNHRKHLHQSSPFDNTKINKLLCMIHHFACAMQFHFINTNIIPIDVCNFTTTVFPQTVPTPTPNPAYPTATSTQPTSTTPPNKANNQHFIQLFANQMSMSLI
eukprot:jgi/Psemu1/17889/gm1.17889_g